MHLNPNFRGNINFQQNIYRPTIPNPATVVRNNYHPRPNLPPNQTTSDSSPPAEIIDDVLPTSPSNSALSTAQILNNPSQPKVQKTNKPQMTSTNTTIQAEPRTNQSERQFGFSRPTPTQIKAQIEEVKNKFNEYSITDCRDKVNWLATIVSQQQLDLDLLRSSALSVEDWTSEELKQFGKIRKEHSILTRQKKKLEDMGKKNEKERADLVAKKSIEKEEFETRIKKLEDELGMKSTKFEAEKNALEKDVRDLRPYKEKYKQLTMETTTLRVENESMKKQMDKLMTERERYAKMVDPIKLEEAQRERDEAKEKCTDMKLERIKLKARVDDLEKKLIAEKKKNKDQGGDKRSATPAEENVGARESTKREAKLASKDAEIEKLKAELEEKNEQITYGKFQARHKNMELKEKITRKKKEYAQLEDENKVEKEKREKAELEMEKCNKELGKMRKKIEEMKEEKGEEEIQKPKNFATKKASKKDNNKLPLDQFAQRLKEMDEKKAQLESAFLALTKNCRQKCENCIQMQGYLHRAQLRSDELTAVVMSREIEIADLRGKIKEKENENNLMSELVGQGNQQQPQQRMMVAPPEIQQQQQNIEQLGRGQKRKAAEEAEKKDDQLGANKRLKRIDPPTVAVLVTAESEQQRGEDQREVQPNQPPKSPNILNVVPAKTAQIDPTPVAAPLPALPPLPAASNLSPAPAAAPPLATLSPASHFDNLSLPVNNNSIPVHVQQSSNPSGRSTSQPKPSLTSTILPQQNSNSQRQIPAPLSPRPSSVPNQIEEPLMGVALPIAQIPPSIPLQPQRVQQQTSPANQPQISPRQQICPQPFASELVSLLQQPDQEQQPIHRPEEAHQQQQAQNAPAATAAAVPMESPPQDQIKSMAAKIVTHFLVFIGQTANIQRNARSLIPDFIQQYNLPQNRLVVDQLAMIADEAERAKAERTKANEAANK